jgi:hypothetical protein
VLFAVISAISISCGQKGPPLPPIVRTPVAPVIEANRRGATIDLALSVPSANVDGSRPANLTRIDIYAVNASALKMTDAEIMKYGTKVASVPVKSPRTADDTAEQNEPAENVEPPVGEGLDQGSTSAITEAITASLLESQPAEDRRKRRSGRDGRDSTIVDADVPLLGPPGIMQTRTYIGVGIDRNGRPGQFSKRVSVPLQLPPAPPPPIAITYDEKKIVITWKPIDPQAPSENVLPSRSFGPLWPEVTYNLYDAAAAQPLNSKPVREYGYEDTRMTWGTERCYLVRAVEVVANLPIESEPTGPTCKMLVDTFPPAAPKGLNAVATEGAINLIWEANNEPDLAGYYVLRAVGSEPLQRITSQPIADAAFFDNVQRGLRFTYAVQAVDKAGNESRASEPVEETAR